MREALQAYVKRVGELAEHVRGNEQATKQSLAGSLFTIQGDDRTRQATGARYGWVKNTPTAIRVPPTPMRASARTRCAGLGALRSVEE